MTIFSLIGMIAGIALLVFFARLVFNKPSNYLIAYIQDFVGTFFIFSGAVKAIDPLGTAYKMTEYFEVFNMGFLDDFATASAIIMVVVEIVVGVTLILGYQRTLTHTLLFLTIIFFTFLTGFTAIYNKVTDCGCFGDFLKLQPWISFEKDIVLTILIVILIIGRKHIRPWFSNYIATSISTVVLVAATVFCLYNTLWSEPVVDFRPYAIGKNIPEQMTVKPEDQEVKAFFFTYKNTKTGKEEVFKDSGPDGDEWEFVSRRDSIIKPGKQPKINNFHIENADGEVMDDEVLHNPDYSFMVVSSKLETANKKAFAKLNAINEGAEKDKLVFFAVIHTEASNANAATDAFRHEVQAAFPFHYGDATFLKTIVRSNPGLLLLKNGTVVGKWHYTDIPSYAEIKAQYMKK
ncbi:MAG: hypothetical protein SFW35_10165 [Chitinophagales bacterium]|nr:hypothetical protein [Chitinophagales bacterium]